MSASVTSAPLSSVDGQRMSTNSESSKQNNIYISATSVDISHLSPLPSYQTNSNSASPSNFDGQAELTSENSVFSDYDYAGDDEFFGVNFDTAEDQGIDVEQLLLTGTRDIPLAETHPPGQTDRGQSSETATSSTYPMSSNQSSPPSRHSPKNEAIMSSQLELPSGLTVPHGVRPLNIQTALDYTHRAVGQSGSGYGTGDNIGLGVATYMGHSPRLTFTSYESLDQQEMPTEPDAEDMMYDDQPPSWQDGIQDYTLPNQSFPTDEVLGSTHQEIGDIGSELHLQEGQDLEEESERIGLDPERRHSLANATLPNFKEQEEAQLRRLKNMEVETWRSQAGDSTDAEDIAPNQASSTLNPPPTNTRRRARSTGAIQGYFPPVILQEGPRIKKDPTEGEGIDPVSDTESIRENQYKDGRIYYNSEATIINDRDRILMQESSYWNDAPVYPYITNTRVHGQTANEAAKRWNEAADTYSVLSRTATWGTRRRSEPSIADMDSIHNGSFLKRLSFKTDKEFKKEREKRPNPLIDSITNIVRRKSDSKPKRNRSTKENRGRPDAVPFVKHESGGNLAPPPGPMSAHKRGLSSPRLNTNVGGPSMSGSSQGGSGSVSATASSPKKSSGFNFGAVIRRARSGSNLQHDPSKEGIYGMWKQSGGPPVARLGAAPFENDLRSADFNDARVHDFSDADGDDDDEEEPGDDGEMMDFDQNTPITPNLAGFQEHVIGLYPMIEKSYLVDRIAHQQVVRYKALLQWRVKHQGSIAMQNCPAGHHCIALGGSPTLLEAKNQHRDSDASVAGGSGIADVSDGDSNPEGALAAESFPPGVPMPPAQTLPAEFECQLCFRVKKFSKPSDWTKHVHEDVQPFTCTYANCKEPKSFKRKADWVRHENERHRRLSWWTCTQDDCQHKCYRKDNFLQHLVREHKIPEPKQRSKAAAKKARNSDEAIWVLIRNCHHETAAKPQDEPCKFCGKVLNSWKKLTVHLAKHMELISLSVLRLVEQQIVSADTVISPVEPLPVRQAPLTPVDRTDRRPSNGSIQFSNLSASISPHPNAISQFSSPLYPQASPNIPEMPQFSGGAIYDSNMGFSTTNNGRQMASQSAAPTLQQYQSSLMMENSGMSYNPQMGLLMDNTPNTIYSGMDHSPSLEQSSGFTTVSGTYTPVNKQQGYHSYPGSTATLSPDPSSFVSGPPQMPAFQTHTLNPNQQTFVASPHQATAQHSFASSPHHASSYPPPQVPVYTEDNLYNNQILQQPHNELSFDQMGMGMGNQGSVAYQPTSNGNFSYHQQ